MASCRLQAHLIAHACWSLTLCSQAALVTSKAKHSSMCKNASKEERRTAWQEVLQQVQSSFVVVSKRIKRKVAETLLQHNKLVDAAKLQALKAFDQDGLLASLAETGVLNASQAQAAYKVGLRRLPACFPSGPGCFPSGQSVSPCTVHARRATVCGTVAVVNIVCGAQDKLLLRVSNNH